MKFIPKPPRYTIPTTQIAAVTYTDKKAVGIQFVDPEGGHIFITIPGALVPQLAESLQKVAKENPDLSAWAPAPYASTR